MVHLQQLSGSFSRPASLGEVPLLTTDLDGGQALQPACSPAVVTPRICWPNPKARVRAQLAGGHESLTHNMRVPASELMRGGHTYYPLAAEPFNGHLAGQRQVHGTQPVPTVLSLS